ncbi:MAG: tRNA (N(6)-L-threonylcarbamoyladenosine(37)-C(2))-methylthiotransferase MtaB [Rikenellaceae bacterium]
MKKVSFHTLGCKMNFSETATLAREFEQGGFIKANQGQSADICVINSCSVTDHADKKCRNLIRKLHKDNPDAIIAVTGCYAQLKPEQISEIPGVDLVISNNDKNRLYKLVSDFTRTDRANIYPCEVDELTNFFSAFSSSERTRAFLKVQDGCDYRCSYCTIPNARGKSRNIPINQVITQAKEIAKMGQKEIVITGINTGDFGKTTGEKFIDLLKALDEIEGIERYRISSIEPNLLSDEIIDFCAKSSKFQPHFHIPLQNGSNNILALMRRRYTTEIFEQRIMAVKRAMRDVFIGIDVIVGFPGESDEGFDEMYNFLERIEPAYLHIFPYSERANTPAIDFPGKVSPQKKQERAKKLDELCKKLHNNFALSRLGSEATVLFESRAKGGLITGFTENYLKVEVPYNKELINTLQRVKLNSITLSGNIIGEILK